MELLDRLIITIIFMLLILLSMWLYRYIYILFNPYARKYIFKRFYLTRNCAATIHLAGRIFALSIIFSHFHFFITGHLSYSILNLIILSISATFLYIFSIYILESIIFTDFTYTKEIIRYKNNCYATISLANNVALALLFKGLLDIAHSSITFLILAFPIVLVIISICALLFPYISKMKWKKLIIRKNMAMAMAYLGHIVGCSILLYKIINREIRASIFIYLVNLFLSILTSIFFVIFCYMAINFIFNIERESGQGENLYSEDIPLSLGIGKGVVFLSACIFTAIIVSLNFDIAHAW